MFRYGQGVGALFGLEHRHSDGTWERLEPAARDPHDQAGSDPERQWERGHVFVCPGCGETVRVSMGESGEETPGQVG